MLNLLIICLAITLCAAKFQPINYRNCKSNFNITKVEADGCQGPTTRHCAFKRGTEPVLVIEFIPSIDTNELETSVRAKLSGSVIVPFNLDEDNPCIGGNLACPLLKGKPQKYRQSVKILNEYPLVNDVQINWMLNDKSNDATPNDVNKREICIIFLAKIVDIA